MIPLSAFDAGGQPIVSRGACSRPSKILRAGQHSFDKRRRSKSGHPVTLSRSLASVFFALILSLIPAANSVAQPGREKPTVLGPPSTAESTKLRRELAVSRVKGFVGRILSFQDVSIKTLALAEFADLLWVDDEAYARQLFSRALDFCAPASGATAAETQSMASLRRQVIVTIAKRDAKLAKSLAARDKNGRLISGDDMKTNFEVANRLVKSEPDEAKEFVVRSLQSGVDPGMAFLLTRLRAQNESAANQLFLMTLETLSNEPMVDPDTLMLLGTYLFTYQHSEADPPAQPGRIKYVGVGPVLVIDITADLPNIAPQLVLAYLRTATGIISRSSAAEPEARSKYYATGYLLLGKTQRFAPDLTPRLMAAMWGLRQSVPAELTEDSTYEKLKDRPVKTFDEALEEIDHNGDLQVRDSMYLALVSDLWAKGDFIRARRVNAKISDTDVRDRLTSLIDFGEASHALENGKSVVEVTRVCDKLQLRIERLVLRLAIARASTGDPTMAMAAINDAIAEARKLDDDRAPFISLSAVAQLASLNPDAAAGAVSEVVKQFNARKGQDVQWQERVEAGVLWRYFPMRPKGVNYGLSEGVASLMAGNPDGTIDAMGQLEHEKQLAQALTEISAQLLK